MFSRIVKSHSGGLPTIRRPAASLRCSCYFIYDRICSKQFSKSSIHPITRKLPGKDQEVDDTTQDSKTSKTNQKSSWVMLKRLDKLSRQENNARKVSSSDHSKKDWSRRWKAGAEITEHLDKIKAIANQRRRENFSAQGDRHFGDSDFEGTGRRFRTKIRSEKPNNAEIKRCVEILRNQKERLQIFSENPQNTPGDSDHTLGHNTALDWWNQYTQKRVSDYSVQAPTNHYMEMLRWSEEGRLWSFPVDNEEGLEEEKDLPFYKHVFLDELIEDGFPKAGPVRKFMEAVTVGLSTNPYLTYKEKEEHINWFRDYFNEKKETLETLGISGTEDNVETHTDN